MEKGQLRKTLESTFQMYRKEYWIDKAYEFVSDFADDYEEITGNKYNKHINMLSAFKEHYDIKIESYADLLLGCNKGNEEWYYMNITLCKSNATAIKNLNEILGKVFGTHVSKKGVKNDVVARIITTQTKKPK